jgi:hypothetical protein
MLKLKICGIDLFVHNFLATAEPSRVSTKSPALNVCYGSRTGWLAGSGGSLPGKLSGLIWLWLLDNKRSADFGQTVLITMCIRTDKCGLYYGFSHYFLYWSSNNVETRNVRNVPSWLLYESFFGFIQALASLKTTEQTGYTDSWKLVALLFHSLEFAR